jgi:hypothetical protein
MNKFLRIVSAVARIAWSFSGIIIFIFLSIGAVFLLISLFNNTDFGSEPEIIVGRELEEAKAEGLILQGLTYDQPRPILYSDHFLLPVSVKTYENPKETRSGRGLLKSRSIAYAEEYANVINIVFLNRQMEAKLALLNRKAFIKSVRYPSLVNSYSETEATDTLQRHITYLITFEDTNNDGSMNKADNDDLYISDLDGGNFKKITSDVDVTDYRFLDRNQILIKYKRRGKESEEHKREYFIMYLIKEGSLKELSSLNSTLDKIESIIVK